MPLGVVVAAQVQVREHGHLVEQAQQEQARRLRERLDHPQELEALLEDALLVLRVLCAVVQALTQVRGRHGGVA